jgi:4-hydroxyproline epimerase
MAERREDLRRRFDHLRRAVVCEPRGHDAVVGALLTPPVEPGSAVGVVFFNDVGYLGMCGHGLIGVVRTLEFLGRLLPGAVSVDTPAGTVRAELEADGSVVIENVPSYRYLSDIVLDVPGVGVVTGDVAYGGNWFYLAEVPRLAVRMDNLEALLSGTRRIREELHLRGVTGAAGAEIDHIELFGPPSSSDADSRNFVLCPGAEYDRSPCGTGTSAKMATLHARGGLRAGQRWVQESITGSIFTGWLTERDGDLMPHVRGRAWITGKTTLHFDPSDAFRGGIPPA